MQYQNGHLGLQMNPAPLQMVAGQPMSLPNVGNLQAQQQQAMLSGQMSTMAFNGPSNSQVLSSNGNHEATYIPTQPQDHVSQQQQQQQNQYRASTGQEIYSQPSYMSPQHQIAMPGNEQTLQTPQHIQQVNGSGVGVGVTGAVPLTVTTQLPYVTMMNSIPLAVAANTSSVGYGATALPLEQYNHHLQHQQQHMANVNLATGIQTQITAPSGYNANMTQNIPSYPQAQQQ